MELNNVKVKIGVENIDKYIEVLEKAEKLTKELKDCLWELQGIKLSFDLEKEKDRA